MKILNPLKAAFGKGRFSRVKDVSYHQWEDAFGVEFDDGLSFLEPHSAIRKANKISANAIVERVALDEELRHGFFIHYDTGEVAEVSWAFIRELPPKKPAKLKTSSQRVRSVALLLALFQSLWLGAQAQTPINTGSDGHDGALNPTNSITIDMADHPDGIYHYTSVNIPANVTVTFKANAKNTPVVWLVQGTCVINGVISIRGEAGTLGAGGRGGPGGFGGGNGAGVGSVPTEGLGPGGGEAALPPSTIGRSGNASFATRGGQERPGQESSGEIYGNNYLLPLIGGSGGGGSPAQSGALGGGGGGGAILVAATDVIEFYGWIDASGGDAPSQIPGNTGSAGAGSGGAVRLLAATLRGRGAIGISGGRSRGSYGIDVGAGRGRIRFDVLVNLFVGGGQGYGDELSIGFQPIVILPPNQAVSLMIQSIGGTAVAANPAGSLITPDVIIPGNQQNPITVTVRCSNIPLNTEIILEVKPANAPPIRAVGLNNQGTQAFSTATVSLNLVSS